MIKSIIRSYLNELARAEGQLTAGLSFPGTFEGFKGHFPGHPIVPGVCWVQTVLLLGEILLERELKLVEIVSAKFFSGIGPDQDVLATCRAGGSVLDADFSTAGSPVARIKVTIVDA